MTLDEAIKHLEEILSDKSHKWSCESCKQEHKQLLVWLKELKALKEINGGLISRDALKEYAQTLLVGESINTYFGINLYKMFEEIIDNAPTIERPQGECKTCRYRDPEDKKCNCGALERAGCIFPVSDDYFCKFYEGDARE